MIVPKPVPERSLRRLRRRYAWLMLGLAAPVLVAAVYLLALQYEIVKTAAQRQLAMSAERRVAQLDAVLERMREDLQRLAVTVRAPDVLARDVEVDKRSLALTSQGLYSLDNLPALLRQVAPQVILAAPGWDDVERRNAAVEHAAVFAEQVQLAMSRGDRFSRATYVDVDTGEVWIYPWVASARWLAELSASAPQVAARLAARQAGLPDERLVPIEGDVRWRVRTGDGRRLITLGMPLAGGSGLQFVIADVTSTALDLQRPESGGGRFWVVDREGHVVVDHFAGGRPDGGAIDSPPLASQTLAAALVAPSGLQIGPELVAARSSAVAPWVGLYATDLTALNRRVVLDMWPFIGGGALLLLLFVAIAIFIWRRFGQPSLSLVDFLHRQAVDPDAALPHVPKEWVPWLHLTRDTFAAWREAAVREQKTEALKSAIVDHALAAVVTTDAQGRIVEFNPAAERMFLRTRDEMIGRPAGGTIVPDSVRVAYLEDLRRMNSGKPPQLVGRRVELMALRPDGSEFPVDVVLWRSHVGGEIFITASLYDASERRAAAEEIARQREALRQSEKLAAMGSLLAGVAHELNNPLGIVMGRASLLEDKCSDPALRSDATRIREAAERCGRIVRSFLGMARRRPAVRSAVQLNDLALGAVDLLQYSLRTSGIALEQQLDPDLPVVLADADKLGQVLLNLLVNAQQALGHVDPPRRMRIETGRAAGRIWLRIADNGVGVPESDRHRIFDAFVTTKAEGVGTGMGLALSRSVAMEHDGGLCLEDESPFGRGASFRLDLPLRAATLEAEIAPATESHDAEGTTERVLVVDDEPELAAMMRDALERAGYEVASAESGVVALALLDEGRFDAIVSDLRMPDMDGSALWRAVRERDRELAGRCVFVTGDTLSPLAADFQRESAADVLEKPFTAAELVRRVRRCLAKPRPNLLSVSDAGADA